MTTDPDRFLRGVLRWAALFLSALLIRAQAPALLNYQGRVQVGTSDFNGVGQFKFALVSADGINTYWSNDGTASGQPANAVTLAVTRGLYSVLLGQTSVPNLNALPATAFTSDAVYLRVWFNDGVNGFQQFVPDQRVVNPPYAATAGALAGPIRVDQLPAGVPRATNGTTPIAGDVVVQGTLTAAGIEQTGVALSSGLPPESRVTVLINNRVAPGVRFEGLKRDEIRLSRATTDTSWPGVFGFNTVPSLDTGSSTTDPVTNPPIAIRLSLPNGGEITWSMPGSDPTDQGSTYTAVFSRPIARDGKPFDRITLKLRALQERQPPRVTRSEMNLSAMGALPILPLAGPISGQPQGSSLRLIVDGVNYNNVAFQGEIDPILKSPVSVIFNSSSHRTLAQWAVNDRINGRLDLRSVEIVLVNGLADTNLPLANVPLLGGDPRAPGVFPLSYEVRVAADGLPYEVIEFQRAPVQ